KASDEFAVPLCRVHHRAAHRARDEQAWWQASGIDPIKVARKLWKDTRVDEGRVEPEPERTTADRTSQPGADVAEPQAPTRRRADMLTQIEACAELFHTATGTAFADLLVDGHRETWPIRSKRFRGWLRRRYYEATGGALAGHAISLELDLLEARAQFDAPE